MAMFVWENVWWAVSRGGRATDRGATVTDKRRGRRFDGHSRYVRRNAGRRPGRRGRDPDRGGGVEKDSMVRWLEKGRWWGRGKHRKVKSREIESTETVGIGWTW